MLFFNWDRTGKTEQNRWCFPWDHCSDVLLIGQSDGFEFLHEDATVIAENVLAKQYTDTKGLFLGHVRGNPIN